MKFLLRWAWPFLAISILFEAFSDQIFYGRTLSASLVENLAFSLGMLIGDFPIIFIVAVIAAVLLRMVYKVINARTIAVSLAIGCLVTAILIRPIITQLTLS